MFVSLIELLFAYLTYSQTSHEAEYDPIPPVCTLFEYMVEAGLQGQ